MQAPELEPARCAVALQAQPVAEMAVVNNAEPAPTVVLAGYSAEQVEALAAAVCSVVAARAVPVLQGERKPGAAFELVVAQELAVVWELVFALEQCEPAEHLSAVV